MGLSVIGEALQRICWEVRLREIIFKLLTSTTTMRAMVLLYPAFFPTFYYHIPSLLLQISSSAMSEKPIAVTTEEQAFTKGAHRLAEAAFKAVERYQKDFLGRACNFHL